MHRPWLLVVLALGCTAVFPPLGLLAGAGGALYAHRAGETALRNFLLAFFVMVLALLAVLQGSPGL